jgi:hypothetical protein
MAATKLILIEGIPGSGKTTAARFVGQWLASQGIRTALFLEGAWDHPADFESVAVFDAQEYAKLLTAFPGEAAFLESQAIVHGGEHFFRYRQLQAAYPDLPGALIAELASREIYELPAETYRRLVRQRWQQFATSAAAGDTTFVFECAFMQNPMTMMLGRHDEPAADAGALVLDLAGIVQPLSPRWLYLHTAGVRASLTQVASARPAEWLDFVIAYHTQQGHGKAQGWEGFDGLVSFYEMRQSVELALLPRLPFPGLLLHRTDWAQDEERIAAFLAETFAG